MGSLFGVSKRGSKWVLNWSPFYLPYVPYIYTRARKKENYGFERLWPNSRILPFGKVESYQKVSFQCSIYTLGYSPQPMIPYHNGEHILDDALGMILGNMAIMAIAYHNAYVMCMHALLYLRCVQFSKECVLCLHAYREYPVMCAYCILPNTTYLLTNQYASTNTLHL